MRSRINWTNTVFLFIVHVLAGLSLSHLTMPNLVLGAVWFFACGMAITGGYHRLFSHPTYKAVWPLRLLYLLFGAASVQNSALKWSADHRRHHAYTDKEGDPYNIKKGFWWAHIGWVLTKPSVPTDYSNVKDLERDALVRWQHRFYVPLAVLMVILPAIVAQLWWGDGVGALLVAGFLRLTLQYHVTFSVNSFAHWLGSQPYSTANSARDSWITALLTLGEGYHNFHHKFQNDYRNGIGWYQFDPTKWFVWLGSKVKITWDLRRTPRDFIDRARGAAMSSS